MKKTVIFDKRAQKEFSKFPQQVRVRITALAVELEKRGSLEEPDCKKIDSILFEVRVRYKGQWRALYAYVKDEFIIILCAFHKKTQKAPRNEIQKAKERLREYEP